MTDKNQNDPAPCVIPSAGAGKAARVSYLETSRGGFCRACEKDFFRGKLMRTTYEDGRSFDRPTPLCPQCLESLRPFQS